MNTRALFTLACLIVAFAARAAESANEMSTLLARLRRDNPAEAKKVGRLAESDRASALRFLRERYGTARDSPPAKPPAGRVQGKGSADAPPKPAAPAEQSVAATARADQRPRMIDFTDPTYGGRVRQIYNPAGDEHNLYHYRSVFNADNSRLLGIETPKGSKDYLVTLYDGDGRFLKRLFTAAEYDWRLAWDRRDAKFFYTWKGSTVHRFDVETGKAEGLKSFENPGVAGPSGLSLNEKGDRLLLRMTDKSVRTYRLPAMDDERICAIEIPDGWYANWDKLRFTGHKDYFALTFEQKQPLPKGARFMPPFTRIYDGVSGKVLHTHDAVTVGHHDFSPDGKFAYVEGFNQGWEMKVRVVNLDGTDRRSLLSWRHTRRNTRRMLPRSKPSGRPASRRHSSLTPGPWPRRKGPPPSRAMSPWCRQLPRSAPPSAAA